MSQSHSSMASLVLALAIVPAHAQLALAPAELIADLNTRMVTEDSTPVQGCRSGGLLYFTAEDHVNDRQLWRTDGTSLGTVRLTSLQQGIDPVVGCGELAPNGITYMKVETLTQGAELWRSDGTVAGTFMVKDINPGTGSGFIDLLGFADDVVLFVGNDGVKGEELWVTDGTTAGTVLLMDIHPGAADTGFAIAFNSGPFVYFGAEHPTLGRELWRSDGTVGGTMVVKDINPGAGASMGGLSLVRLDSTTTVFIAETVGEGAELWRTDGTGVNTQMVADLNPGPGSGFPDTYLTKLGNRVVFPGSGDSSGVITAWGSDGMTIEPLDGPDGDLMPTDSQHDPLSSGTLGTVANGKVLFMGRTAIHGDELWSSDGTTAGTVRLTDIAAGADDSQIDNFWHLDAGDFLLFSADTPATGTELWVTDGTASGTSMLTQLTPGAAPTNLVTIRSAGDAAYIVTEDDPSGSFKLFSLWRYEHGMSAPAHVFDFQGEVAGFFNVLDEEFLFSYPDAQVGMEPWISDGTQQGTRLLRDIAVQTRTQDSGAMPFAVLGDVALMSATDGSRETKGLWRTDGTVAGTTPLLPALSPFVEASFIAKLGTDRAVFAAQDMDDGTEGVWVSDGTVQGTIHLGALVPTFMPPFGGGATCSGNAMVAMGGVAYFSAIGGSTGSELWRTDGTVAGTQRVADIAPGSTGSLPCHLVVFGDAVYFAARTSNDVELWRSDGTSAGTRRVADIRSNGSSSPSELVVFNDTLYFFATDDSGVRELWRSDGTASGTTVVTHLTPIAAPPFADLAALTRAGPWLYFSACRGQAFSPDCRLWRTDGTSDGTIPLASTSSIAAWGGRAVGVLGDRLLFAGNAPYASVAPWITDGTVAGTHMLALIEQLTVGTPIDFTDFNGISYFRAPTRQDGLELWRTDGTQSGTLKVAATQVGYFSAGPDPWRAAAVGQRFVFMAYDDVAGRELWVHENKAPLAFADSANAPAPGAVDIAVLANDADPDGALDPASIRITAAPASGTTTLNAVSGVIRYAPSAGFAGEDHFSYVVADSQGHESAPAVVSVTVSAAPPDPTPDPTPTPTPTPDPTPTPVPTPTPPQGRSGGGGGGGALEAGLVMMLAVVVVLRNLRPVSVVSGQKIARH